MEHGAIKQLRKRQIVLTNILILMVVGLYFAVIMIFSLSLSQMNTITGVILFIYALYGYMRKDKTTSFIPIFEEIAIYEKEKMGDEWTKQRKTNGISLFILSGFMFLNAFITRWEDGPAFTIDMLLPIFVVLGIVILIVNLFLMIHIRKVDRSISKADFTGYTLRTNIIAITVGVGIAVIISVLLILYFVFIY